jgi:N-methylhydantoinase A
VSVEYFVGTDVGGTFTDVWVATGDGRERVFKASTTRDVIGGVLDALAIAADSFATDFPSFCSQIERFSHGTTVGLNALLTGTAARTGVITTRGFGDTLTIGRMRRQSSGLNELELSDFYLRDRFAPLVPRTRVFEVPERIDVDGRVVVPLDEDAARAALRALREDGVEAIAICTLWSTHNPVHERRLRELAEEELPGAFVSVSHEISPTVGEYARMSTTAANAALGPVAGRYLSELEAKLTAAGMRVPVLMMTSAGGVLPTSVLAVRPAIALFSGPSAGVIGAQSIGAKLDLPNVLAIDIGGTSFDVGVISGGRAIMRSDLSVAGADLRVLSVDVASIGAGGGSLAAVEFGELHVGPSSAGAQPGPACYGRGGTRPTATDADLVLGVLDTASFIGGRMRLDVDAARRAIDQHVAQPLGMTITEAAWSIREVLDNRMADLLRRVTIERGHDPRDFAMLAYGGAGPSHAWVLSRELGLAGFIVPAAAGTQSAYGAGNADLGLAAEQPAYGRIASAGIDADTLARIDTALVNVRNEVERGLASAAKDGQVVVVQTLAMRYRGQDHHFDVPVSAARFDARAYDACRAEFERRYEANFGRGAGFERAGYEILSVRAIGTAALRPPALAKATETPQLAGVRDVIFDDPSTPVRTSVYATTFASAQTRLDGPCILEYPGQSVVVPAGFRATADEYGNIHVGASHA